MIDHFKKHSESKEELQVLMKLEVKDSLLKFTKK